MFSPTRPLGARPTLAARAAVAGTALAVGLTACGGSQGDQGSGAASTVRSAYETTTSAETVRIALTGRPTTTQTPGKQQASYSGKAVLDFKQNASSVSVDGKGSNDSKRRTIDDVLYRKIPQGQRAQVPGKKPWIKMNLKKLWKAQYGKRADSILDNPLSDPIGMLTYLRGVTHADESGTAEVRGTQTTHYTAKVNLQKAAKDRGPQVKQRMRQLGKSLGKRPMEVDVWLDGQNRVRRLQTTLPARKGNVVLTEEFYNYGASLQVNAPAQEKTANVTKQALQRQKMREQMQKQRRQKMREKMQKQRQQQQQQQGSKQSNQG